MTLLGQNVNSYRDISEDHSSDIDAYQRSKGFTTIYKNTTSGATFTDLLDRVSQVRNKVCSNLVNGKKWISEEKAVQGTFGGGT